MLYVGMITPKFRTCISPYFPFAVELFEPKHTDGARAEDSLSEVVVSASVPIHYRGSTLLAGNMDWAETACGAVAIATTMFEHIK